MELTEPKRKRRVQVTPKEPFPIPIESFTGVPAWKSVWQIYTGKYNGVSVTVDDSDEMSSLYNMGFFGKGSLSHNAPVFGKWEEEAPPILYNRQWKQRCRWTEQKKAMPDSDSEEDSEDVSESNIKKEGTVKTEIKVETSVAPVSKENSKTNLSTNESGPKSQATPVVVNLEDDDVVMLTSDDDDDDCITIDVDQSCSMKEEIDAQPVEKTSCVSSDKNQSSSVKQEIEVLSVDEDQLDVVKQEIDVVTVERDSSSDSSSEDSESDSGNRPIIVLSDGDCNTDSEQYLINLKPRLEREMFPIRESLHLTLEESFFLSYGLGCLQVIDMFENALSLLQMWRLFCDSQKDFVQKYVVYHYFRAKGWVVKPGIKFGTDFLLYKQGPPFYHASYIVMIEVVPENTWSSSTELQQPLTWTKYLGMNRLAETAGKEVLLCRVVWPRTVPSEGISSPQALGKFTVQEVLMRRWQSSQERSDKDKDDISDSN